MGANTHISWCDHTINFWIGCVKVSPGCKFCYAEHDTFARRERSHGRELWGPKADRHRTSAQYWKQPYKWNKVQWEQCTLCGWRGPVSESHDFCPNCDGEAEDMKPTRQRVFISSLSDICEIHFAIKDEWRDEIAQIITECSNLDWLFLTKRPMHFNQVWLDRFGGRVPDNVWVGTSIESNDYLWRVEELVKIEAKTLFLSCEPLLGPINFDVVEQAPDEDGEGGVYYNMLSGYRWMRDGWEKPLKEQRKIDWVIVGGESGPHARPMDPKWAISIRDQCRDNDVPFHFKQWGAWTPDADLLMEHPNIPVWHSALLSTPMLKAGKQLTGNLLEGQEYQEFPR